MEDDTPNLNDLKNCLIRLLNKEGIKELDDDIKQCVICYLSKYSFLGASKQVKSIKNDWGAKFTENKEEIILFTKNNVFQCQIDDKLNLECQVKIYIPVRTNDLPSLYLVGDLNIQVDKNNLLKLKVLAHVISSKTVIFICTLNKQVKSSAFNEILKITGESKSTNSNALTELKKGSNIDLTFSMDNLTIYYSDGKFSNIVAEVSVSNLPALEICGKEIFKVPETVIKVEIKNPFDRKSRNLSLENWTTWKLDGNVRICTYGQFPGGMLWGGLHPKDSIDFTRLMKHIASIDDDLYLPNVEIMDLEIFYNYQRGDFNLEIEIASDLKIGPVELTQIDARIEYESSYGMVISLNGYFRILEEMSLFVEANYNNKSWMFRGSTSYGQKIEIGKFICHIATKFGVSNNIPHVLSGLVFKNLDMSFDLSTKDFTFGGEADFKINDKELVLQSSITLTHNASDKFDKNFLAKLLVDDLVFDVIFDQSNEESNKTFWIARYNGLGKNEINLDKLLSSLIDINQKELPQISIRLQNVLLAYLKTDIVKSNILLAVDLDSSINISKNMPLVGTMLSDDQSIKLSIKLVYASQEWGQVALKNINKLLETEAISINGENACLNEGGKILSKIEFGTEAILLDLPLKFSNNNEEIVLLSDFTESTDDKTKWFNLQKKIGPLYFSRIGLEFDLKEKEIKLVFDANIKAAGLTIDFDGLSFSSSIDKFNPKCDLKGLGIDFRNGPLEIGGTFLRQIINVSGKELENYSGQVLIKMNKLSISAFGSYINLEGHPSLFIYSIIRYPLGGPPFFFVTGLAAGFGYNRLLNLPSIDKIHQFPLVAEAMNDNNQSQIDRNMLTTKLKELQSYIPPKIGSMFLAIGVKFNSFKLINSFALISASFGNRFELSLLGISTLVAPPQNDKTPLARIEMYLKATFIPEEGFLGVRAQLSSNSYILSEKCRLTGGFAFYTWLNGTHKDDFVITLGGYHPKFNVPSHYPNVPRLNFNWEVDENTTIKGSAYFALCPHAYMVGGHLEATYTYGPVSAWFICGIDFLISWQPYYYEADMYVNMGASYTFWLFGTQHLTVNVGANLHLEGPEFGGYADISLWIATIHVKFGEQASKPQAISWQTFRNSFLPEDSNICQITVGNGLVSTSEDKDFLGVINPKDFLLVVNSVIPLNEVKIENKSEKSNDLNGVVCGIGSMKIAKMDSTQTVRICKDGKAVTDQFIFVEIKKKVPTALWGSKLSPSVNGQRFIDNALTGYAIAPKKSISSCVQTMNFKTSVDNIINVCSEKVNSDTSDGHCFKKPTVTNQDCKPFNEILNALGLNEIGVNINSEDPIWQRKIINIDICGNKLCQV
jgi:hypothetical protein